MAFWDFLTGGSSGGSSADQMTGFAPSMSPGQIGVGGFVAPTADDPSTSISQTGNIGSGLSGTQIAKALQSLQSSLKSQDSSGGGAGSSRAAQAGQAASGTGQGSASGINALVNMLLQRQNQYFPGGPNTQPVAQSRNAGLLGF